MRWLRRFSFGLLGLLTAPMAFGFCGFYVARADTRLYNQASRVVLVRDGDRTVVTMASDFRGDPKEFAVVVPVPTLVEKGQIHLADQALLDHLDAYSAPRLVEYFDGDPCALRAPEDRAAVTKQGAPAVSGAFAQRKSLGVTVEASYSIGEYDIVILSARQSQGLETWLIENGYRIPRGASRVLEGYLKQGMHFFVAKVNLERQARLGFSFLRPIQIAYESPKFTLPIRLGMVNADGPQELYIFALSRAGRVETTNYRTVKLPTGMELPLFVKGQFGGFYKAMFGTEARKEDMRAVFTEYAWDTSWCDPCAANPLSREELRQLGVFWTGDSSSPSSGPEARQEVFLTRLHLRYDAAHFPEDLVFQATSDRENFQGRYVIRHPWSGSGTCEAAVRYREALNDRREKEARELASLTDWDISEIRRKMIHTDEPFSGEDSRPWWERLWPR
jgi:hypothetical protein